MAADRVWTRIGRWEPLLLVALAPAFLFITPRLVIVLLALPLLWLCRRLATGRWASPTPLNAPLLILLLALLVNVWITPNLADSLPKIAGLLYGVTLYYALIEWAATERRRAALLLGSGLLGLGLAGITLLAPWTVSAKIAALQPTRALLASIPRPLALPGATEGINTNQIAGVISLFAPFCARLAWDATRRRPRAWLSAGLHGLTSVLAIALIILSQSRLGIAGLLIGLLSLGAWRRWFWRIALVTLIVATLTLAATDRLEPLLRASGLFDPATSFDSLNGRLHVWQRAVYFLAQAPFTGIGLNQFRAATPAFWPVSSPQAPSNIGHAHNQFLQAGVEMGILGLVGYLGVWLALFWRVFQTLRRPALPAEGALLAAASGLVAYGIYGLADAVALGARGGYPLWLFFALTIICSRPLSAADA